MTKIFPQHLRVDANQPEIVAALRGMGASVLLLNCVGHGSPDILVGWNGNNVLMEIKSPDGKLTDDEKQFFDTWRGPKIIVRSIGDAIQYLEDMTNDD